MNGIIRRIEAGIGAIPTIDVEIEIKNIEQKTIYIIGYSINLSLCKVPVGSIQKFRTALLEPRMSIPISENFPIVPFIFQSIERERKGGDVPVNLGLEVLCIETKEQVNFNSFRVNGISTNDNYKLSERDWINMISKLGYSNYAIFEIQYPKQPTIQSLNEAIRQLEKAQQLLNEGKNEEVVTECRKSFEILNRLVLKEQNSFEMNPQLSNKIDIGCIGEQSQPSKSKRIADIHQKIFKLLHIGPHYGYTVSREDAEYIFWLCLSTIRYYATIFTKSTQSE